jgi:hypothetical protein
MGFCWDFHRDGETPASIFLSAVLTGIAPNSATDPNYPRESCNMAYNTPKMLNKINTSIKEIMMVTHPLSLSYMYTPSR